MIWRRDLAEDATQEILIKAVTKLSTFRRLSRFRTWLYRIAVNHLLGMRKSQMEENMTFTGLGRLLDELPNAELFRGHGFLAAPDLAARLRELIRQSGFNTGH